MRRFLLLLAALGPGLLALAAQGATPAAANFSDSLFCANVPAPTAMALAPDGSGRVFVCLKNGTIGVIPPTGGTLKAYATVRPIFTEVECGVLGICFHPDFLRNRVFFVFATVTKSVQKVFVFRDLNGVGVGTGMLPFALPTRGLNHDGGGLGIGPDGRLYWSVGDNGNYTGANNDLRSLAAKVGRANLDGSAPLDNPFNDGAGPNHDYIWATGFRNPFALTTQPRTGQIWLSVVGSSLATNGYEQIFTPAMAEDGGWNSYEGNQPQGARYITPRQRPLAHPVLQYKTNAGTSAAQTRNLGTVSRTNNVLQVNFATTHPFRVGQLVLLQNTGRFDGSYIIASVTATGFTAPSEGANDLGLTNVGAVRLPPTEGCVTGGAFYESTVFPAAMRGSYFFGDCNSGNLWNLRLDADTNQPLSLLPLARGAKSPTSMLVDGNGALLYTEYGSNSIRAIRYLQPTSLVVTPAALRLVEGALGVFTVRLPAAPSAPVTVTIDSLAGTPLTLLSSPTLTFTAANWSTPQIVRLSAPVNNATRVDTTVSFGLRSSAFPAEVVTVTTVDTTASAPVVSATELTLRPGGTGTVQVSLPSRPAKSVVIGTRLLDGSRSATVTAGATLTFTPANWNLPQTVNFSLPSTPTQTQTAVFQVFGLSYFPRFVTLTLQPAP